ncbi:hypothetical protein WJX72_009087 [[Myrmecia] bisecta]|uniref:Uncharacterized protein n=1 Tax=[Myrmecia] bisecta TaxID=41462 RepID=A0AAW1Q4Y4_9CHLO
MQQAPPRASEQRRTREDLQQPLDPAEIERRVSKVLGLIATSHQLAPFDRSSFNQALVIWKAVADIPAVQRKQLVERVPAEDIHRLWRVAGQRCLAPTSDVRLALGPDYFVWDDFPDTPNQVAVFDGKATAFGGGPLHLNRFQKAFFLHPRTLDMYGRVLLHKGPLGELLYPLYYRASVGPGAVPATREVTEMQLEYLQPDALGLTAADLPPEQHWPAPKGPLYPFSGDLTDYLRPVGPGVYVGVGWKAARKGKDQGRRFLSFILAKAP